MEFAQLMHIIITLKPNLISHIGAKERSQTKEEEHTHTHTHTHIQREKDSKFGVIEVCCVCMLGRATKKIIIAL